MAEKRDDGQGTRLKRTARNGNPMNGSNSCETTAHCSKNPAGPLRGGLPQRTSGAGIIHDRPPPCKPYLDRVARVRLDFGPRLPG